jgi:hypothetical protein
MDGPNILVVVSVVILIIVIVIILIIAFTGANWRFKKPSGTDEVGNWINVSTPIGVTRAYIFNGYLENSNGQFLNFSGNHLTFGEATLWNYDGRYISTFQNSIYYYISLDPSQDTTVIVNNSEKIIVTTEPLTAWLFDGYQFCLTSNLALDQIPIIDSLTLNLSYINAVTLYSPSVGWIHNG